MSTEGATPATCGAYTARSLVEAPGGVKRGSEDDSPFESSTSSLTRAGSPRYDARMRILVTGGVKSGKSRHALELAAAFEPPRRFLATALAFDDEMREKIARHRAEREGRFETIEEPLEIHERVGERMILDCVPLWLNNLLYYERGGDFEPILGALIERLPRDIVIVTNEVGMGFVPVDPVARRYGVLLGTANARLAAVCDRVVLMVAGIPLRVK
ncbi:MAG: bifunctional adenosylcobinamide kinase/adenosylcobinamide-phosphate guanylyltransferase [Rectinemataceae bacterium]